MNSLNDITLESNPYMKINFEGGDLSSDAGLLLIKEFAVKVGLVKLIYLFFKQMIQPLSDSTLTLKTCCR